MKQLIVNAFAVVGFAAACVQIWQVATTPSSDISAVVSYATAPLPPEFSMQLKSLPKALPAVRQFFSRRQPLRQEHLSEQSAPDGSELISLLTPYLEGMTNGAVDHALSHDWFISVTNTSTVTATTVALHVPGFVEARINPPNTTEATIVRGSGERGRLDDQLEDINIGILQPKQTARIWVWTSYETGPITSSKITLTHDHGSGSVTVYEPTSGSTGVLVVLILGLVLGVGVAVGYFVRSRCDTVGASDDGPRRKPVVGEHAV